MEASGKRFAWILFMAIMYAVLPANHAGAAREASAVEPVKAEPCVAGAPGQWARLARHSSKQPRPPAPCVRKQVTT